METCAVVAAAFVVYEILSGFTRSRINGNAALLINVHP